jgi:hypothetical protein
MLAGRMLAGQRVGDRVFSGYQMVPKGAADRTFLSSRIERRSFVRKLILTHYGTTAAETGAAATARLTPSLAQPACRTRKSRGFGARIGMAAISRKEVP